MNWNILLKLFFLYLCAREVESWHEKVLLNDVNSLTFYRGERTAGRRTAPIPQMSCVDGKACGEFVPTSITCSNVGTYGYHPQWKCQATLPRHLGFGRVAVSCEGYDYPGDPYVLKGSCGLQYSLSYIDGSKKSDRFYDSYGYSQSNQMFGYMFGLLFFCVLAFIAYNFILAVRRGGFNNSSVPSTPQRSNSNNDNSNNQPAGDGGPSPASGAGFSDFIRGTPGFWTGTGVGGLFGYLFGRQAGETRRRTSYRNRRFRRPYSGTWSSNSNFHDYSSDHYNPVDSYNSGTYTATAYADTEIR
ncbi:10677_t:CDS:2 [Paraglomus brasilianum]|uniref:Store-operated calcium entry-associated regulatory factor n=1 Tax=Paraglomus brasilianum TaxID=144538 RepID=A0A9N9DAY1_9GLOM|nr:10677_t:CDS:2 [Paraglomus brasilianum]